ncbi:MAG TPA: hypothetical protein VFZ14_04065 [Burkholderiales bacterium]|nr:hypothetical protein [Burkholderiales bacterium]
MHALWIPAGIVIWGVHFAFIYGFTALACARGEPNIVPWLVLLSSAVAATLAGIVMVKGFRARCAFIEWMSASVAAFALIAIAYETLTALLSPSCA